MSSNQSLPPCCRQLEEEGPVPSDHSLCSKYVLSSNMMALITSGCCRRLDEGPMPADPANGPACPMQTENLTDR